MGRDKRGYYLEVYFNQYLHSVKKEPHNCKDALETQVCI